MNELGRNFRIRLFDRGCRVCGESLGLRVRFESFAVSKNIGGEQLCTEKGMGRQRTKLRVEPVTLGGS